MRHTALCLFAFWMASSLVAQTPAAVVTGVITDPDGGVVPGAIVQAINVATQVIYKATSRADGNYTMSQLPADTYHVVVPSIGFTARLERKDLVLQAGQSLRLDLRLNWGGNLGTPGDDISSLVRSQGRPTGPTPRTPDGKPDFLGVWIGKPLESENAVLLPWADSIYKQRQVKGGAGNPGESCLPGDVLLVSPFLHKVIQTHSVIALLADFPRQLDGPFH
jgi:hypothetical protein